MIKYKRFQIYYAGQSLEEISATSKRNVEEYVRDEYKGKQKCVTLDGGIVVCDRYILKYFEVRPKINKPDRFFNSALGSCKLT